MPILPYGSSGISRAIADGLYVHLVGNETVAGNKSLTGATSITAAAASNRIPLAITQNDTTNNPQALTITNASSSNGIAITQTGSSTSDSSGGALLVTSNGTGYGVNLYSRQATAGEQFRILKDALNSTTVNGSQTLTTASTTLTVNSTTGFPSSGKLIVENSTSIGENNNTILLTYTSTTGTTFVGSAGTFYPAPSITLVTNAVVKQVNSTDSHYAMHIVDYSDQFSNAKLKVFSPHPDLEFSAFGGYNNSIGQGQYGQDIAIGNSADVTKTDAYRFLGRNDANTAFNPAFIYTRPGVAAEGMIGVGFQSLSSPTNMAAHVHIKNDTNFGDTNAAALIGQIIQGASSQTANLLEFRADGSTTPLAFVSAAGSMKFNAVGTGIFIKEGANAAMGIVTLVAGTATVSNTRVTATSRIFCTHQSLGTVTSPVGVGISARTAGTSFTITSMNVLDTSVIAWQIVEPA